VKLAPIFGSPALSMMKERRNNITWLIQAKWVCVHGGFFVPLLKLLAAPAGSRLDHFDLNVDCLTVFLETTTSTASCPLCGSHARRVHSRYTRQLADLPCFGRAVQVRVRVRRFFCGDLKCPRRIFAERLPGFVEPHARTTSRLNHAHEAVGCAFSAEAGSRLSAGLAITTSPDTLLRRVKRLSHKPASTPRFIGIDGWAWRRGKRYGTILVDLDRGEVIDLLPDREVNTVKMWLNDHPDVEVISRDRSSSYAQAVAEAAPEARQVADRWHLLKNLREAIERLLERQSGTVNEAIKTLVRGAESPSSPALASAAQGVTAAEPTSPSQPLTEVPRESPQLQAHQPRRRRVERFERVHERHRKRHSARRIARELGMSWRTVRRYLQCTQYPDRGPGHPWHSRWEAQREWIDAQLAGGDTNAADLHRQLTARGFRGSYCSVQRYVRKWLGAAGRRRRRASEARPTALLPPSPRQLSFEWARRPEDRKPNEQRRLDAIRASGEQLATALGLADEFADLLRKCSSARLSDWLLKGEACSSPEIRRFARGIRRDESAVLAVLSQRWSNGSVEGHINRLKTVKRQMYGRAGFVLLRARILCAA
jgi:transposase